MDFYCKTGMDAKKSLKKKVLFLDTTNKILPKMLSNKGFECIHKTKITEEELMGELKEYIGIVLRSRIKIKKHIIDKAKNLKFIARLGSGMESIDVEYAEKNNIKCFNSPEGNRNAVAEHAMAMLLSLSNNLIKGNNEVENGIWLREENRGFELEGKTIGIIGYGNTGSTFAKKLSSFDINIIAYDKYKTGFGNNYVKEVGIKEIYENADIISFHIPSNKETEYMADKNFFSKLKKQAVIINTSRGKILKTVDLVQSLINNKLKGACLDVLEYESHDFKQKNALLENSDFLKLKSFDNVILSPHIAGWTIESNIKLSKVLAEKIINEFG